MSIKRKIIGWSYSKLLVLPKYWITQHNLKKGDTIQLDILQNGDLLIKANQNAIKKTTERFGGPNSREVAGN